MKTRNSAGIAVVLAVLIGGAVSARAEDDSTAQTADLQSLEQQFQTAQKDAQKAQKRLEQDRRRAQQLQGRIDALKGKRQTPLPVISRSQVLPQLPPGLKPDGWLAEEFVHTAYPNACADGGFSDKHRMEGAVVDYNSRHQVADFHVSYKVKCLYYDYNWTVQLIYSPAGRLIGRTDPVCNNCASELEAEYAGDDADSGVGGGP